MASATVKELFSKIRALAKINDEIIARIRTTAEECSRSISSDEDEDDQGRSSLVASWGLGFIRVRVTVFESCPGFTMSEIIRDHSRPFLLGESKESKLREIKDIFNDKLTYDNDDGSFEDLVKLNSRMLLVAEKFDLLDPVKAIPFLKDFLFNFEMIQVKLGEIEEFLLQDLSYKKEIEEKVKQANNLIDSIDLLLGKRIRSRESMIQKQKKCEHCFCSFRQSEHGRLCRSHYDERNALFVNDEDKNGHDDDSDKEKRRKLS